jgi:hypothetical protein
MEATEIAAAAIALLFRFWNRRRLGFDRLGSWTRLHGGTHKTIFSVLKITGLLR